MKKLTPFLIAAVCSVTLLGTGCPASNNGNDAGNNTGTDAGQNNTPTDAGQNNTPTDAGPVDAGPNCDGGNCYLCTPTNYEQLVNHCTNAQQISKSPTLPYLPDGGFPPLP